MKSPIAECADERRERLAEWAVPGLVGLVILVNLAVTTLSLLRL